MEYKEEFVELTEVEETAENTEEKVEDTAAEQTEEKSEEPAAEQTEETVDNSEEYAPQFEEIENIEEEPAVQVKEKKKFPIYVPIIIAACVLVGAIVAFFAVSIFVPTIEGTWIYEAEDGNSFYYTFDEKADENICEMSIGTIYFPGTYALETAEDKNTVLINLYAGYVYGSYTYDIEGVALFGNRVLTLTGEDGKTITFTQAKKPSDKEYIKPDKDFKEVEALTGEWECEYPEYNSSFKLTINDDGTLVYDQFGLQEIHCVYTATDSIINLSFYETEVISQEEGYYFNDDQLVFLGLNWTRVDKSTADEAK